MASWLRFCARCSSTLYVSLGIDSHQVAAAPDAALEHIADAEIAANLPNVDRLVLVGKSGVSRDDEAAINVRQIRGEILCQAIGEVLLVRVTNSARNADAANVSQGLQAGGDVDAIAEYIPVLDHHVAQIDADPELDPPIPWHDRLAGNHGEQELGGTANGLDRTGELDEQAVSHAFDDPTAVPGNGRVNQGPRCDLPTNPNIWRNLSTQMAALGTPER